MITLRYIATGQSGRSLSQQFRVGRSTVSMIIRETAAAIISSMQREFLHTPVTTKEWQDISQIFANKWQFPHCLGAIDGKHFRIIAPAKSGSLYYNYKGYFSILVLAVVNAN